MDGEFWWKIPENVDAVFNDFADIWSEKIFGEFGEPGDPFEFDLTEYNVRLKSEILKILKSINDSMPENVQKCVIAGMKKALIDKEFNAKSLDEDEIISDNRTVEYVRHELLQLSEKLISNFAVQLSDTINTILGDV